jgi:predicted Zn-dependent peptidase
VVREERRMRTESDPQGKLIEQMQATAIQSHPYRVPPVGWASDIDNLRVEDARKFFKKYYVPANMTIAIVGDIDPARAKSLAQEYFGRLPKAPLPGPVTTLEPDQVGPKRVEVESPAQPIEIIAYHRPDQYDKDDPVLDVVAGILSEGRTSVIYRDLVRDKRLALGAGAESTFPGGKYPGLFFFYLIPALGHTVEENQKELDSLLADFEKNKIDEAALARVKTRTRAGLISRLDNNQGLAQLLAGYYANYGDWRKLFTELDEIDKVTAEDVQRAAKQYFVPANRTIALTVKETK